MAEPTPADAAGPPPWFLLATVAASGAAVMIVEMTAVRALQPAFGSTTMVWANVIATVLAALALGGWLGGRLADRHPSAALLYGSLGAGGVLVAAAALLAAPASRLFVDDAVEPGGLPGTLARGSLGTALIVFAPPLLLLGAVTPIALRLLAYRGVGRAAGAVIGVSTAGSIAGTYLPALVLVPHLGSRGSLLAAAALLAVPAAIGLARTSRRGAVAAAALVAAIGGAAAALSAAGPLRPAPTPRGGGTSTLLAERESPYQYLAVREDRPADGPPARVLTIDEAVSAWHALRVEGRVLTGERPHDDYATLPLLLDLAPGAEMRMSVLGFACGVNAAQWRHFWDGPFRLRVDGAEIDPEVLALGREFFGLREGDGVAADARPWLRSLPPGERRHVIVVDAFARELYVPFHLATREFFEEARARLEPGGVLAMNCWAVGPESPNLAAIENTLATVFGACLRVTQHGGANFLLLARRDGAPSTDGLDPARARARFGDRPGVAEWDALLESAGRVAADAEIVNPRSSVPVLTDDHAPVEWLTDRFLADFEEWRTGGGPPPRGFEIFRLDPEAQAALARLRGRQDGLLAAAGAGWALVLAAALMASRARFRQAAFTP